MFFLDLLPMNWKSPVSSCSGSIKVKRDFLRIEGEGAQVTTYMKKSHIIQEQAFEYDWFQNCNPNAMALWTWFSKTG